MIDLCSNRKNRELRLGIVDQVIGVSSVMNQQRQTIEKVAPKNSRILITGPLGSGKELTARLIYSYQKRANGPFVTLNAAVMDPDRIETERFGIEEDNLSENRIRKIYAFWQANSGTLFLDEIVDMPLAIQGKIVRLLVDQTFDGVGGVNQVHADVRVMSSSSKDIGEEINAGRLRSDLFHRLNVVPIRLTPLNERREDIPMLVE